ncbi:hypothetical protein CSC70_08215 [Pseudoxanthomonas kalamensis DSM 18571]|uniref:DUF3293 domain-containing protein n=1 Tax=Pseudoxanthomonas kalamensis TaxID=289483 RepID=UPI001B8639EE|nr:DUF3293 domain-containing protein [Pseudoxanthomonas kalamensis]KAF1710628.1 hypothetical protein CSC70_08215 [Pseudoxanthomonas kalamensis DSM 18571]
MSKDSVPGTETTVQLARAYALAHYFVAIGRREWLFQVGMPADDIERLLPGASYTFITAWNPHSDAATPGENRLAGERLSQRLSSAGYNACTALGCNAQGGAVEYGQLVSDLPLHQAEALARDFGQAGILYWQQGQPVRLRMLWPRPDDAFDHPYTDWAG